MKALTYLLIGILSLSACTSQNATSIDNAGSFLCIPPEYAVFVGETGTSSAEFDSQGGGYNVSIFLNQNTVSQLVPEYKSETNIGGRVRKHALYITLSPSEEINQAVPDAPTKDLLDGEMQLLAVKADTDRKSTRLNSSHVRISYAVFCLKKKIGAPETNLH